MALPRALFIDMDDTLIVAHGHAREAWRHVLEDFTDHFDGATQAVLDALAEAADAMWSDAESHRIWRHKMPEARREVARRACRALGRADDGLAVALGDAFSAHRESTMCLFEGTVEALEALRGAGVQMALVTNGGADFQRAKVDRFDLARHFDLVLIEGEFGVGKPDDRVYRHLLEDFAVAPAEAWMIGDDLEWEVVAPQRHGIRGIWFDGYGQGLPVGSAVRPDAVVTSLGALMEATLLAE